MRRRIAAIAATVAAAGLVAGTAVGATPASRWMGVYCAGAGAWYRGADSQVKTAFAPLGALSKADAARLGAYRATLASTLGALAATTAKTAAALRGAGTPAVPHGDRIEATLVAAFDGLAAKFRRHASEVRALPTSTAKTFVAQASAIANTVATDLQGTLTELSVLRRYDSKAIDAAIRSQPACSRTNG